MSASKVSTGSVDRAPDKASSEWFANARWLARKDIERAWVSYPASALLMLLFVVIAIPSLSSGVVGQGLGISSVQEPFTPFAADVIFVMAGCLIAVNWASLDYLRVFSEDVFSERTTFLLGLPLATGTLVAGRAISMLAATPLTALVFFVPLYILTPLGELGFDYVWFVGIWLGWAVLYGGVTLLCELGLSSRTYCWMSFVIVFVVVASILMVEALGGISLVGGSVALADRFGPVPAIISLVIGVVGFWLLARLTVKRIDAREVGS